jgi:hypothetical protein
MKGICTSLFPASGSCLLEQLESSADRPTQPRPQRPGFQWLAWDSALAFFKPPQGTLLHKQGWETLSIHTYHKRQRNGLLCSLVLLGHQPTSLHTLSRMSSVGTQLWA